MGGIDENIFINRSFCMVCPNCNKMVDKMMDETGIYKSWKSFDAENNHYYYCASCKKTSKINKIEKVSRGTDNEIESEDRIKSTKKT